MTTTTDQQQPAGAAGAGQTEKLEILLAVAMCYGFALQAILAIDEDEHTDHDDCDGLIARTALETGKKLLAPLAAAQEGADHAI